MEQNESAVDDVACSSKNWWDEPSPQFTLVGNYLPEEIRGDEFPESPSVTFECRNVVDVNACLATKGKGRLFVPTNVLQELSKGVFQIENGLEICAAPGLPPKSIDTMSSAKNRSDLKEQVQKYHNWYWKHLAQAIKPVAEYIPEDDQFNLFPGTNFLICPTWRNIFDLCQLEINADLIFRPFPNATVDGNGKITATLSDIQETKSYLNTFQINHTVAAAVTETAPVVFILDDNIDLRHLHKEEKNKYKKPNGYQMEPSRNRPNNISHGTKIFKFIAATSAVNTEICFLKVGGSDNVINFYRVVKAFRYIIDCVNEDVVWINCSFTLSPLDVPSDLLEPGIFYDIHRIIHKMGFVIVAAAGNHGYTTPHHPWGECPNCISVGAEDNTTQKIAGFSSGCCNPLVNIIERGTNFAVPEDRHKFDGTSYATAIISGALSFIIPNIWTVDHWKTIHDLVKDLFVSTSSKKFGCGPAEHSYVPLEWNRFSFQSIIHNLVLSGKLHPEVVSSGSRTTSKVNLRNRLERSLIRIGRPSKLPSGEFPKKWLLKVKGKKALDHKPMRLVRRYFERVLSVCLSTRNI